MKQQKDRKLTVYEKLRNETIDYLDACFRLESTSGSVFLTFLDQKLVPRITTALFFSSPFLLLELHTVLLQMSSPMLLPDIIKIGFHFTHGCL